ncbi:MAG: nicotinate phosphoribosyltransferase [Pseudomonadota bacterium]
MPEAAAQRDPGSSALLTDLYQLTMLLAYREQRMADTAVFEFFVRKLPPQRNFLIAAGLEQVLEFLEKLRFAEDELDWLREQRRFRRDFVDELRRLRFTGDVHAMPEGTIFFPHEPILRVTAPLPEAQLVETRIINILHLQTIVASKAARCVLAAPDRLLVDFGLRRAHGAEAGLLAARAAYLAGFGGTATVLAGQRFGIPLYGTMAHSFIQAHTDESLAFEHFARAHPDNTVLLIDTYDTEAGAAKVVALARRLKQEGIVIQAVRLDSGDLGDHARKVRRILDDGGFPEIRIFASGGLDERVLHDLLAGGAPIDGFGIGTSLVTSEDAPALDCAYKLQEYAGLPRRKRSEGKATWPGRKQVYRDYDQAGRLAGDIITVETDACPGEPLLEPVMTAGRRVAPPPPLDQVRGRMIAGMGKLPPRLRGLERAEPLPVAISSQLKALAAEADRICLSSPPI